MRIEDILEPLDTVYLSRVRTPGLEARLAGYRAALSVAQAIASKQGVSCATDVYAGAIVDACKRAIAEIEFALTARGVAMEGAKLRRGANGNGGKASGFGK